MAKAEDYWGTAGPPPGTRFDAYAADRACDFIERFCVQSNGEWGGQTLVLSSWQRELVRSVWGWKRANGTRQFRTLYLEVPRKNGKSTLSSALALLLLIADGEPGAKVFAAAADKDQAKIVFEEAQAMVDSSPALKPFCNVYKHTITVPSTRSRFEVISAIPNSKHGKNISGVVIDELHVQPNRELYDVLRTGTGSRRQPLTILITTAGYDRTSVCWEQHERTLAVMRNPRSEPAHYGMIFAADEGDDWTDPATWAKANPNLGVSVKEEYLEDLAKEASVTPGLVNNFLRLHLNVWTSQETRWIDMGLWDACEETDEVDLEGRECYGAIDLASTNDMAAFGLVFPPSVEGEPFRVRVWYWIPGVNIQRRVEKTGVPYDLWKRQGLLKATPGNVIDYSTIIRDILTLAEQFRILEIAYDPWGSIQMSQELGAEGFTMIKFRQGWYSFAAPTKEFGRLVASGGISHDGNAILRWNVDNVQVAQDPAGNLKPNKATSKGKIDGLVTTLMALDRATRNEAAPDHWDDGELYTV